MGNPSNNQKIKKFNSKDPNVNKMENLDKTAYIKTYTLRDIGDIDNNADECIVDMNNPIYSELDTADIMTGNQPRIQSISIPEVEKILEEFGYSPSLAREILELWVLTDDKIKSIGRPLNLTKESNKTGTNLDDYFYFSLCNPPPMSLSSVHSHLKGHEDLIRQAHEKHGSSIPKGLSNCMPLEPLVLEVYTQKILAARKFTTIFVSTNGSLYHLYFSNEHGSDFPGSVISIYDEPGNEAQTNPHYSTYDNVDLIFRNRDIINQITIDFNISFDFDWEFTVPNNRWLEYTSQHIPNYLQFGSLDTTKAGKKFDDFINMEIMFYNGQDVFELNVEYEIENADGKPYRPHFSQSYIPKSRFRQMNAKLGILCAPTYLGCSTDDGDRTDGKLANYSGSFPNWPTKDAHDECNRRAFQNGHNTFGLQYDNQCWTGPMTELEYYETIDNDERYYMVDEHLQAPTNDKTNDNATTKLKTCTTNNESRGHKAGGPWSNAVYRVQNDICYKYSKVCLKLDETYGFYLERTLAKNNSVERLIFWDIRKYRINPLTDLVNNPEWSNTPVRFPDGEIKQSEFISLGQVMLNKGSKKTMKVYLDQWGHWRILLSINPCPTKNGNSKSNIEELLREIRGQYDNREWTSMFSNTLDYGPDGSKINGSHYNPTYHDRFLKFYKKTPPNDKLSSTSHDIVLRFDTDDSVNPLKNKTTYYRLKPDELQKTCGNFIRDEMAMMPPDLFNTGYKPIQTIKNNTEDTCLSLCKEEEKCDFAVLQGKVCHLYDKAANKYLINKDNKYVPSSLSADHNVYRKVCMPSTAGDQQNTEMGRAGFVIPSNNPVMNINMELGKNFMILNNNPEVSNFNADLEKYRVENLKPHEFNYNNLKKNH